MVGFYRLVFGFSNEIISDQACQCHPLALRNGPIEVSLAGQTTGGQWFRFGVGGPVFFGAATGQLGS